mmetsp:Transcript_29715/g.43421  ORF Transcript_29715/g.43421 Transcript_29715/m.43421 type:complete len:148 (-) Transcript_29715:50-493(-)
MLKNFHIALFKRFFQHCLIISFFSFFRNHVDIFLKQNACFLHVVYYANHQFFFSPCRVYPFDTAFDDVYVVEWAQNLLKTKDRATMRRKKKRNGANAMVKLQNVIHICKITIALYFLHILLFLSLKNSGEYSPPFILKGVILLFLAQ